MAFSQRLSRSSPVPLYQQLASYLDSAVRSGVLKPGDQLDPETVLTQRFNISRITVRQAIDALVAKQILVRKQGKGTFVTQPAVRHDLRQFHGLFDSLFAQAPNARTKLLRYELSVPPAEVVAAMRLPARQPALALDRLYLVGDKPIGVAQDWLDPVVASIARSDAERISTEEMMRRCGLIVAQSEVSIRAETAGAPLARRLKISPRAALLVHRRRCFDIDGAAKEIARISISSDDYEFAASTRPLSSGASPLDNLLKVREVAAS